MDARTPADETITLPAGLRPVLERAIGHVRLAVKADAGGRTRIDRAFQEGSLKVRFPHTDSGRFEAVLLNTAGGLTDGDVFAADATAPAGTALTLTTQAAEKVYRAAGADARLDVRLALGADAALAWLPQETILYDGGRLARTLTIDMAGSARLIACEMLVLGRTAHGETVRAGALSDQWRIRRDGRLVYADAFRIDTDIVAAGRGGATLAGGRATASLLLAAADAGDRLDAVRALLDGFGLAAGASAWDGLLAVRAVADDAQRLRRAIAAVVDLLAGGVPRVWSL
ncbi:urease accessory protein UreD [Amorphus sp. MBR-141]